MTGSAQGLGKAFAVRLLAGGAKYKHHSTKDPVSSVVSRVCISDVREEGGLATLEELREKFGSEKVELQLNYHQKTRSQLIFAGHLCPM